ncbi:hypothetical protein EVB87_203 [Rhizobium phage RHph_N28_1]|nr:hypothetical protein EVB87_203 [Rhizobium phage RHph_N28_1]QIG74232.1 hypothetical protein EVC07_204 [Rhizobium phage RHph_N42]QXV73892.1 hypothetical protein [Rhizobium phage RHph_N46]
MAKNTQSGAVIALATVAVTYEGTVLSVSNAGVKIATRDLGKQKTEERFFGANSIVANSAEGEGFVIVRENRPVAAYHGGVFEDGDNVSVDTGETVVTFRQTEGLTLRVDYDSDGETVSSTFGKIGKRNSDKLGTRIRNAGGGKADGGAKKKKKKKA